MASVTRKPTAEHSGSEHGMRLRFSSLLAACFLVVAAVALAYVAGVMSGRAYTSRHNASALESAPTAPLEDSTDPPAAAAGENSEKDRQILAPEELRFARCLARQARRADCPRTGRTA